MSTLEANKALVRRHFTDALYDPAVCDAIYAPPLAQAIKNGAERLKAVWSDTCAMTIDDLLAEEDRVMVRWTFYGTHQSEFVGLPATNRQVSYLGVNIFHIQDGKIVEILSMFADESFDLVFHPVANTYVPEICPVWREAYRVLQHGGALLAGFINPVCFIFDDFQKHDQLVVKYPLPFSELTSISEAERQQIIDEGDTLQFSHTFDDQIGGQLEAGFLLAGFFEDRYAAGHPLVPYMPTHFATRAIKP